MDIRKCAVEVIGTFWPTFAGCGSAVVAAAFPQVGIGLVAVSLALGLTVVTIAYAVCHDSGCHLMAAVMVGRRAGGSPPWTSASTSRHRFSGPLSERRYSTPSRTARRTLSWRRALPLTNTAITRRVVTGWFRASWPRSC